ncbi:MAG: NlpC/P60 family protein [Clostridiales bacterium]|nr:NlpC/P60 family protein [Clostridiales bacterium]MDD6063454.1 NlpC/P60 family protein [Clostridiales bacterium]
MKKFKRLTALALALVMVLGLTTGAGAAGAKYSSWFAPYYKEMQELGILPSSFTSGDLTATITRGEMCELAVVAFEKATGNVIDELERTDYFTDTTDKSILKAYEYGIVSGYPDGSFQPNKTLTRQEFFKIIQNFCEAAAYTSTRSKDLSTFADSGSIGSWAREAAQLCVSNAFVDGTKTGSSYYLRPTAGASRQEAMVMFLRAYKDVRQWYDVNITNASVAGDISGPEEFTDIGSTTMYITASKLNVRAYPSTDEHGTILGKLSFGDAVTVTGKSNKWYRIKFSNNGVTCDAYVSREYVDTTPTSGGSSGGSTSSGSGTATDIANFAMSFVGYSYVWGGMSPSTGFDCSGLMYYVLTQYGYSMKRVANDQMTQGTAVSRDNLQVGDLVFFGYGSYANHVGMYIGNGNFVHASTPSTGVRVNSLNETYYNTRYIGARRII